MFSLRLGRLIQKAESQNKIVMTAKTGKAEVKTEEIGKRRF